MQLTILTVFTCHFLYANLLPVNERIPYSSIFNTDTLTFSDAYRLIDALDQSTEEYSSLVDEIVKVAYVAKAQKTWNRIYEWYALPPEHPRRKGFYAWNKTEIEVINQNKSTILSIQELLGMSLETLNIDPLLFHSLGLDHIDI